MLAGRRSQDDPLARAAGAPHRALLDLHGTPMLERVIACLAACDRIGPIGVSIDTPELIRDFSGLAAMSERGVFAVCASADSPSRSVLAAMQELPPDEPLLVTTADHALLEPEMVERFLADADATGADLGVGLVSADVVRARFPESRRTYWRFAGEGFSGANLFAFRNERSRRGAAFWRRAEALRKQPWRLVGVFGPVALALFAIGRLRLERAFERVSNAMDARVVPVLLPFAEAAVDVDRIADLELVREILAARAPD